MPKGVKKVSKATRKTSKAEKYLHKNLDLPAETALYYGFSIIDSPTITKDDMKKARIIRESDGKGKESLDLHGGPTTEERVALTRIYNDNNWQNLPQPMMLYCGSPFQVEGSAKKHPTKDRSISLEIMGTPKSVAEAILIKTALEILKDEGYENLNLQINSIGDRDTLARFTRELTNYYRKNIEELPAHCRQTMKKDILELLHCQDKKCVEIKGNAPKSMSYLSEPSRQHFKEVLEYLEILDVPYEINHCLVGCKSFACQTLFTISSKDAKEGEMPLAIGVRYANVAKKMGLKKDVPGIGVKLNFKIKNVKKNLKFLKPKIYFIQLGFDAKLKSLKIIEILRQAKIPVQQSISRDKLGSQLSTAENLKIPYTILMGQKEAIENTVIVRNMFNRSQESISIEELPKYLRSL